MSNCMTLWRFSEELNMSNLSNSILLSYNLLLVVFEFENDGLNVLALALPLLDALLGVGVEVLLLLVLESLVVHGLMLIVDKVLLSLDILFFLLLLEVVG